jgi:hypothetical protein
MALLSGLPDGIGARIVAGVNGPDMHVLEAGGADAPVPRDTVRDDLAALDPPRKHDQ